MCRSPHRSFFIAYGHPLHPPFPPCHSYMRGDTHTQTCRSTNIFMYFQNKHAIYSIEEHFGNIFYNVLLDDPRQSQTPSTRVRKTTQLMQKYFFLAPKQNNICCRNNDLKSQLWHFVEFESTFQVFAFVDICYLL